MNGDRVQVRNTSNGQSKAMVNTPEGTVDLDYEYNDATADGCRSGECGMKTDLCGTFTSKVILV
jgi:hypothetical protein